MCAVWPSLGAKLFEKITLANDSCELDSEFVGHRLMILVRLTQNSVCNRLKGLLKMMCIISNDTINSD